MGGGYSHDTQAVTKLQNDLELTITKILIQYQKYRIIKFFSLII